MTLSRSLLPSSLNTNVSRNTDFPEFDCVFKCIIFLGSEIKIATIGGQYPSSNCQVVKLRGIAKDIFYFIVPSSISTEDVILSDWRDTGAGSS